MRSSIENRVSRRRFDTNPFTDEEKAKILSLIEPLNEQSGLSMTFVEDGSSAFKKFRKTYGLFTNVRSLILMKGKKEDQHLKEKVGYYGEDLILSLTDMGLGTCWVGGTFDKDEFEINSDEELICVIVTGKVTEPTLKEKFLRSAIHRKTKSIEERIISDQPLPQWVEKGMKAVLLAPSAIHSQKAIFKYEGNTLSASIENNYVLDLVDLGIAKKHFELEAGGKFELGNGGIFHSH